MASESTLMKPAPPPPSPAAPLLRTQTNREAAPAPAAPAPARASIVALAEAAATALAAEPAALAAEELAEVLLGEAPAEGGGLPAPEAAAAVAAAVLQAAAALTAEAQTKESLTTAATTTTTAPQERRPPQDRRPPQERRPPPASSSTSKSAPRRRPPPPPPPPPPPSPPPPRPATVVPAVGDWCCVYVDCGYDFFRHEIVNDELGGWFPARITHVVPTNPPPSQPAAPTAQEDKTTTKTRPTAAAASAVPSAPTYEITVSRDFSLDGPTTFPYPSQHVALLELSRESYKSLSFRGDRGNLAYQAQPPVLEPGDMVFARYQAGDKYSRGRVTAVYPPPDSAENGTQASSSMLCTIAYDGDGKCDNAILERNVPFQDGTNDGTDPFPEGPQDAARRPSPPRPPPKSRPFVYLADKGKADDRWLMLELDRISEGDEPLPLCRHQQVLVRSSTEKFWEWGGRLLDDDNDDDNNNNSNNNSGLSLIRMCFRHKDVVKAAYKRAEIRYGKSLVKMEWPEVSPSPPPRAAAVARNRLSTTTTSMKAPPTPTPTKATTSSKTKATATKAKKTKTAPAKAMATTPTKGGLRAARSALGRGKRDGSGSTKTVRFEQGSKT